MLQPRIRDIWLQTSRQQQATSHRVEGSPFANYTIYNFTAMEQETGDDYIRRLANFIRTNEKNLAEAGLTPRRRAQRHPPPESTSILNPFAWIGSDSSNSPSIPRPITLTTDTHHLFYIFMRMEALGYDVGTLDVKIDTPSRPTSYVNIFSSDDKSETLSLASFRSSLSAISGLSLGGGWWSRPELQGIDSELKYLYSSFTKLPALIIHAPERKVIAELVNDSPHDNALPLYSFKNIQALQCIDIDPRTLLGWDRMSMSLRSLKIRKSGLEDVSDLLVGAVLDDQARRDGSTSRKRRRMIPKGLSQQTSFQSTRLPAMVVEDDEDVSNSLKDSEPSSPTPPTQLSRLNWAFLKHLAFPDNALTFFPTEPLSHLTSVTHLDLSSNLLVSVPSGLSALYNLISLNLSDNMIDSVLGIYLNLGQVLHLNLSHNRLDSICGLERLHGLERVDLRSNLIDESAEVGRLASLPNISEIFVEGNPFVEIEEGYRITCFDYFWKEGKTVKLDGTLPGFYEKRNLTTAPPEQMTSSRPITTAHSPPVVAVGHAHVHHRPTPSDDPAHLPTPPSSNPSPHLSPFAAIGVSGKAKRKKGKRIVDLDPSHSESGSPHAAHSKMPSDRSRKLEPADSNQRILETNTKSDLSHEVRNGASQLQVPISLLDTSTLSTPASSSNLSRTKVGKDSPSWRGHMRYQTEFLHVPSNDSAADTSGTEPSAVTPATYLQGPLPGTLSSMSSKRRARVSASAHEAFPHDQDEEATKAGEIREHADAYRKKLEALKKDMGEGWLKVYAQSELRSPG